MSGQFGFTAEDAERQAGEAAARYLGNALRTIAGPFGLEKSLERDPAGFAVQFAPLLSALIEAQAREYQSWVFYDRLQSLDESLLSGLADIAGQLADRNAGLCRNCTRERRGAK